MIKQEDLRHFNPKLFAENFFPHQQFMYKSERAYMHYILGQERSKEDPSKFVANYPVEAKQRVFKWLDFLADNPFGEFVRDHVKDIWPVVEEQIEHFSTLNVQICGKNPYCGINTSRMFLHYHPPRIDEKKSMTGTFITPMIKQEETKEVFRYADLNNSNKPPKMLNEIIAGSTSFLDSAEKIYKEWRSYEDIELERTDVQFPETGTLALRFDGARYIHSLENLCDNVYVVLVFNDVVFAPDYDPIKNDDFVVEYRSTL